MKASYKFPQEISAVNVGVTFNDDLTQCNCFRFWQL